MPSGWQRLLSPGRASSPPHFRQVGLLRAPASLGDARWMLRPLGPEGRFKPCYCESFCRRKAKAGVARQWKMQADKSTAAYVSFCTSGFVPRSRGGSPWGREPVAEDRRGGKANRWRALARNESRSFSRLFERRSRMTHSHFCLHHFLQSTLVGSGGRYSRTAFGLRVG